MLTDIRERLVFGPRHWTTTARHVRIVSMRNVHSEISGVTERMASRFSQLSAEMVMHALHRFLVSDQWCVRWVLDDPLIW